MTDAETNNGVRHGFSGAIYSNAGPNRVKVTMPDGTSGLFNGNGRWIEGDVFEADPEMCVWVGAERIKTSHRLSPQE